MDETYYKFCAAVVDPQTVYYRAGTVLPNLLRGATSVCCTSRKYADSNYDTDSAEKIWSVAPYFAPLLVAFSVLTLKARNDVRFCYLVPYIGKRRTTKRKRMRVMRHESHKRLRGSDKQYTKDAASRTVSTYVQTCEFFDRKNLKNVEITPQDTTNVMAKASAKHPVQQMDPNCSDVLQPHYQATVWSGKTTFTARHQRAAFNFLLTKYRCLLQFVQTAIAGPYCDFLLEVPSSGIPVL